MRSILHRGAPRRAWLAVVLAVVAGTCWAQRSTAPDAVPPLASGDGASELRTAFAALFDVGAGDQAMVSFVDHAAVRAGGAPAYAWSGLQLALGVVAIGRAIDADAAAAATGIDLDEVATTVVVDFTVPSYLTLVRARFDTARLEAALSERGYGPVDDDHARRWCGPNGCDGGFATDLSARDDAFALFGGAMGRSFPVALLGDVLAVGPDPDALDATLATVEGSAPSVLDRPAVAALVDALDVDAELRQVWWPTGVYAASVLPRGAAAILFADARRGDDEWLVVAVAFDLAAAANSFAGSVLGDLGLTGAADDDAPSFERALRSAATGAAVDVVDHHGHHVVRVMLTRPDADGEAQGRPAELFGVMMSGVARFALPWAVR